jgi:hypothetical protein
VPCNEKRRSSQRRRKRRKSSGGEKKERSLTPLYNDRGGRGMEFSHLKHDSREDVSYWFPTATAALL